MPCQPRRRFFHDRKLGSGRAHVRVRAPCDFFCISVGFGISHPDHFHLELAGRAERAERPIWARGMWFAVVACRLPRRLSLRRPGRPGAVMRCHPCGQCSVREEERRGEGPMPIIICGRCSIFVHSLLGSASLDFSEQQSSLAAKVWLRSLRHSLTRSDSLTQQVIPG